MIEEALERLNVESLKEICEANNIYTGTLVKKYLIVEIINRIDYLEKEMNSMKINMLFAAIKTFTKLKLDEVNHLQLIIAKRMKITYVEFISNYAETFRMIIDCGICELNEIERLLSKEVF